MTLGENICMGDIGFSWLNLYKQLLRGVEAARTRFVATAEHDVLYTAEHYDREPPRDDTFYYNENIWLVQWGGNHPELNGMYSKYWVTRYALSQLVCNRELHISAIEERMYMFEQGCKSITNAGEPGVCKDLAAAYALAKSGKCAHLSGYMEKHLTKFNAETFETKSPNLDIRHGSNFTGPKRGKNRTYDLAPWGKFADVMNQKKSK
jgi:hypothetical protein